MLHEHGDAGGLGPRLPEELLVVYLGERLLHGLLEGLTLGLRVFYEKIPTFGVMGGT